MLCNNAFGILSSLFLSIGDGLVLDIKTNTEIDGLVQEKCNSIANALWPLLLTWFNFNPSMDK